MRVSEEAKRLLSTLRAPDGEVLRPTASPEADAPGEFLFRHGRGEEADQIVQYAGRQVLRVDRSVRERGLAVARKERELPTHMIADNLSLEAQG